MEEAASPMSHPEGQRDFLGGLFPPSTESGESGPALQHRPSELGHRTNHAMPKDVMSTIIAIFRRLRQGSLEFKPT